MFSRLFGPKWEHADPEVRVTAALEGNVPPGVLARLAAEDPEPAVRGAAVSRLSDLELLAHCREQETDHDVIEAARARLLDLLSGPAEAAPPVSARLAFLAGASDPALASRLARGAALAEVRLAAIAGVVDQETLCAVACEDPVASVRRAAFARVDDPGAWETIAREARNRDRHLSHLARERLLEAQARSAGRTAAERICSELEGLARDSPDLPATAQRLAREWEGVRGLVDDALLTRFERARAGVEHLAAERAAHAAACETVCQALASLRAHPPIDSAAAAASLARDLREGLAQSARRWADLASTRSPDGPLGERYARLAADVEALAVRLEADAVRAAGLQEVLGQARALMETPGDLEPSRVRDLRARWEARQAPGEPALREALGSAFQDALQALQARLEREAQRRRHALDEAEAALERLDAALVQGELHEALALLDRIRHRLGVAGDADRRRAERIERHIHGLRPRLEELRRWRHWGSAQAREELCQEMEALAASALAPDDLARRVRGAREAWRRVDRDEGPAPQALWRRFDEACERAYAPFNRQREQAAASRARNLEAERSLLAEVERFEQTTDWERPDWQEVDRWVRAARRRWEAIGPVPRQAGREVERGLRAAIERLESRLAPEREREVERRRALIRRLHELAGSGDAARALHEVRAAQGHWRPSVLAEQAAEQALWREFREACDAVLARAEAERRAADLSRRESLSRREAVCQALEALLDGQDLESPEAARRLAELERGWHEAGPVPREAARALEGRYRALQGRLAEARRERARARSRARIQGIRQRAALCAELEARALSGPLGGGEAEALLASAGEAWNRLPPLDAGSEGPLASRLERAAAALTDPAARATLIESLDDTLGRRLALCLELELLAGVDSPPEAREARMRLQVERLARALRGDRGEPQCTAGGAEALELAWHALGPAPPERWPELRGRFERALAACRATAAPPASPGGAEPPRSP